MEVLSNHIHAGKSFLARGRLEPLRHLANHFGGDDAGSGAVAADALLHGDVEEHGFHRAIEFFRELEIGAALVGRQICGVDVGHGSFQFETVLQQVSEDAENEGVNGLVIGVVREEFAESVAGEDARFVLCPSGFAGPGEADQEDDAGLGQVTILAVDGIAPR
jgi:hypothetical protein